MSFMPSGSKMRFWKNSLSGMPEAISTIRPSVSWPACALYAQRDAWLELERGRTKARNVVGQLLALLARNQPEPCCCSWRRWRDRKRASAGP